jgi:peptidoglycan/LPS O-acetylase OafA/YrhL
MTANTKRPSSIIHHEASWRHHIDGMRAISVLAVLFYHVGFRRLEGGFVGVDVFFVISGFLISKTIYNDVAQNGCFSVADFYERRIRRIMPAFIVVTALTLAAGSFLLLPPEFAQLGKSAAYACTFAANIFFYLSSDYFGPAADTQPLLHYWSLGVEEQFYIVFPLIVLAVAKWRPRLLGPVILILAALSFGIAEYHVRTAPAAAFYLAPQRAWELMVGSLLAMPGFFYPTKRILQEACAAVGVALVLLAAFAYRSSTPFPGFTAVAPVAGAALVLLGCDRGGTIVGRVLSLRPLKRIGLWSYSLYLVHWPLIVYARQIWPTGGRLQSYLVIAASILLGWLLYRFVEMPFRGRRGLLNRRTLFGAAGASGMALLLASSFVVISGGFEARLPAGVRAMLAYSRYDVASLYQVGTCYIGANQKWTPGNTAACLHSSHPSVLLWGDSHSADIYQALDDFFRLHGIILSHASASSCNPIAGFTIPQNVACPAFVDSILSWITREHSDVVILSAKWYLPEDVVRELDDTIERLTEAGSLVVILGSTPRHLEPVPTILAKRMLRHDSNTLDEDNDIGSRRDSDRYLMSRYAAEKNVIYVSAKRALCLDTKCPLTAGPTEPIQWDTDHFTRDGAALAIQKMFTEEVKEAILSRLASRVAPERK